MRRPIWGEVEKFHSGLYRDAVLRPADYAWKGRAAMLPVLFAPHGWSIAARIAAPASGR